MQEGKTIEISATNEVNASTVTFKEGHSTVPSRVSKL